VLVRPENVEKALRFLYERAGSRVSATVHVIAFRARHIARDVGLPEQDRARLDEILAWVNRAAPPRRGLAEKNRKLLEHLDDPAFVHRLVTLPSKLMAAARQSTAFRLARSLARDAVAAEILLISSLRVGNVIDLRLGETIRNYGEGAASRWVIDVPGDKVKNRQPTRVDLPPESGGADRGVPRQLAAPLVWPWRTLALPRQQGGHVQGKLLSASIAKRARRYVGARITAHQYRHVCAELLLREDPNAIAIVSQHLGHRDLNTTKRFYAREHTRAATARYHEVLTKRRAAVPARRRRSRKPGKKPA
jgi:integrase